MFETLGDLPFDPLALGTVRSQVDRCHRCPMDALTDFLLDVVHVVLILAVDRLFQRKVVKAYEWDLSRDYGDEGLFFPCIPAR